MVLPAINLVDCPATDLALIDVVLLLAYISLNGGDILISKKTLVQQLKDIVAEKKWEAAIKKTFGYEQRIGAAGAQEKDGDNCNIF